MRLSYAQPPPPPRPQQKRLTEKYRKNKQYQTKKATKKQTEKIFKLNKINDKVYQIKLKNTPKNTHALSECRSRPVMAK